MRRLIWNAQQMAPINMIRAATKGSNRRLQASKDLILNEDEWKKRSEPYEAPNPQAGRCHALLEH